MTNPPETPALQQLLDALTVERYSRPPPPLPAAAPRVRRLPRPVRADPLDVTAARRAALLAALTAPPDEHDRGYPQRTTHPVQHDERTA